MSQAMISPTETLGATTAANPVGVDMVANAALFSELPAHVLTRLAAIAKLLTVPSGTLICRQGAPATGLFVLLEGQVTLSNMAPNGTSVVVEVVRAGGHFVLSTMLARLPFLMNAHASAACRLVEVDGPGMLAQIQEEPLLATAVMRAEARDFGAMVRQVCDLKLRTTAQRLGCYLLELSASAEENKAAFRLPFDKRLLAARLGCRQENLSRAFAALRGLGVETHGAQVILHDVAKLRDYSVPDEHAESFSA